MTVVPAAGLLFHVSPASDHVTFDAPYSATPTPCVPVLDRPNRRSLADPTAGQAREVEPEVRLARVARVGRTLDDQVGRGAEVLARVRAVADVGVGGGAER